MATAFWIFLVFALFLQNTGDPGMISDGNSRDRPFMTSLERPKRSHGTDIVRLDLKLKSQCPLATYCKYACL